jgi:hypothetical protein
MARDLIVRREERIATLVYDAPDLNLKSLVVRSDGLFARSREILHFIGDMTPALAEDLGMCERFYVVVMDGPRVAKTSEARLQKEP